MGCGSEHPLAAPTTSQKAAVDAIEKLGGRVRFSPTSGEVIRVSILGRQVTDAGLVHLKALTSLETLALDGTQITDAGLEHLKGLTSLTELSLYDTQITGPGLVHLKGLTRLDLFHTQVTDAGLTELKAALPKCKVIH